MDVRAGLSAEELAERWRLVAGHRQHALKIARARTASLADAEDIASEALAKAVAVDDLREETVQALLTTIVARLAVDLHRREATRRRHEASRSGDGRGASVEERVTDVAEARWLARQLAKLAVREREVLLHRAAGHTNASAAATLGLSYKSVESAYTRARGHLQLAWKTTLGLVLAVLAGTRKIGGKASTATVTVTAAAFIALVHAAPDALPPITFAPDDTTTAIVQAPTGRLLDPVAATAPAHAATTEGASAAPVASPSLGPGQFVLHPNVGDDDVASAEATLTGDLFESPMESVDRCYRKGVVIGREIGCKATLEEDGGHPTDDPNAVWIRFPQPSSSPTPKDTR